MCASFFSNILCRLKKLRSVSCFRYRMLSKISLACSQTLSVFPFARHYIEIWMRNWSKIVTMCAKFFSNMSENFEKVRPVSCFRNRMLSKISLAHRTTDSNLYFQTSGLWSSPLFKGDKILWIDLNSSRIDIRATLPTFEVSTDTLDSKWINTDPVLPDWAGG